MSLSEFNEELEMVTKVYTAESSALSKRIEGVQKLCESSMPIEFSEKHDYEAFMIQVAHLKHESIRIANASSKLAGSARSDSMFYSARLRLDHSEEGLKDRGFDRPTEALRGSFCDSHQGLNRLAKVTHELDSLSKIAFQLIRALEADELNLRKLMELKNSIRGL